MDRRTFTPMRLIMVLLVVGLALGIGLAVAQTQSAAQPSADTPKSVAQTQEAAQPSGDTPGSAAEKPADTPDTPAASAEAVEEPATAEDPTAQRTLSRMRGITNAQRVAAAKRAAARRADMIKRGLLRPLLLTPNCGSAIGAPCGLTDYFGTSTAVPIPNYANSKLPTTTINNATVPPTITVTGGGIHKFVDSLAGVGLANANNLGNYIPLAAPFNSPAKTGCTPGTTAGCLPLGIPDDGDYYEIGVVDYIHQFHTDLPTVAAVPPTPGTGTNVRGYVDLNGTNTAHYLGPIILAQKNRPVRVKFTNQIVANSKFFIPVDTSVMGAGMGADGTNYSNNRATLHLHGGLTPWISDGTPHQWTAPALETTNFKRGVSTSFVPDMFFDATTHAHAATGTNDPGPGAMTFFYSNQQSSRLMFYHDHSYGITRLNVYAGEAAGYLLHDPIMDSYITGFSTAQVPALTPPALTPIPNNLTANKAGVSSVALPGLPGGVYTFGIPLIIQDKTFVPPAAQLAAEDPTWNWGGEGNLWFPHVYMTNQWPDNPDNSGVNPMGRWDLGAWFWPPMTSDSVAHVPVLCSATPGAVVPAAGGLCPPTPNPSLVPESFLDTPVVNGVAYPTMTLPQGTYRFQILNAANDRMFNLSLFYAAEKSDQRIVCKPGYASWDITGTPYIYPATGTVPNDPNCTEVKMVAAVPHPQHYTVGTPQTAPTAPPPVETPADLDDQLPACISSAANPDVNRGSGFLAYANPAAYDYNTVTGMPGALTPCWPTTWPTDGRDGGVPDPTTAGPAWVQIGTEGGVLPQAVVIPATPMGYNYNRRDVVVTNVQEHALFLGPAERADVIVDFSQVPVGSTLILYNDSPAPVPGFDARLDYYTGDVDYTSTGGAPTTQPGYGPNIRTMMQIQITTGSTTPYMTGAAATGVANLAGLQAVIPTIFMATQATPIIPETTYFKAGVIPAAPAKDTYARIQDMALTFTPTGGTLTTMDLKPKAIHELFENDYGKMNSVMAEEIPLSNFNNQTTIPLAYIDPPTDFVSDGETQLWKVTHNGVDSHAIHFHLFNVQLINRTGWDGAIRPPDPNELGWKETVRMNPLEDAFVALQPKKMTLPANFGVTDSVRLLDPTRVLHATNVTGMPGFTNVDPNGNGITVSNELTNFGWEYVWHCHLLGHEENDMMRPIVFRVAAPLPVNSLTAVVHGLAPNQTVALAWSYVQGPTPALSFMVMKSTAGGPFVTLATGIPATTFTYTDLTPAQGAIIAYQVFAVNGSALSAPANATVTTKAALAPPTNLRATKGAGTVTLTWTASAPPTGVTGYVVQRATSLAGPWTTIPPTTAATIFRASTAGWAPGGYFFQVQAVGVGTASLFAQTTVAIPIP